MRVKMSKQPAPTARAVGPCPTLIQTSRTPRHWKFTQDHRTTRPPPEAILNPVEVVIQKCDYEERQLIVQS